MSKNHYKNYSKFSEPAKTEEVESVEVTEEVIPEETVEEEVDVEETVEEEVKTPVIGVVTGCDKLNVRSAADPKANPVCVIKAASEVVINKYASTSEFYKVCTEAGVQGYCMKKFITIR